MLVRCGIAGILTKIAKANDFRPCSDGDHEHKIGSRACSATTVVQSTGELPGL